MALDLKAATAGQVYCTSAVNVVSVMPQHMWMMVNTGTNDVHGGTAGVDPTIGVASYANVFTLLKSGAGVPGVPYIITGVESVRFLCSGSNTTMVSMTRIK